MRDFPAESAVHIVRHIIAGEYNNVRLQRIDSLDTMLEIITADGPAEMKIAGLHNPHLLERLRQIAQLEVFIYDFQPLGIYAFRTYRPFGAKAERAERQTPVIPRPFFLGYRYYMMAHY